MLVIEVAFYMHPMLTWRQELKGLTREQYLERLEAQRAEHNADIDKVCAHLYCCNQAWVTCFGCHRFSLG